MAVMSRSAQTLPATFVLYWAVATAIGLSVSLAGVTYVVVVFITLAWEAEPGVFALATIAALVLPLTTPLGISQWLVLRRTRLEIRSWIPATTIGFVVGLAPVLAFFFGAPLGVSGAAGLGALLGAPTGVAQWLILRRRVKKSGLWILGTTGASAAAVALVVPALASPTVSYIPASLLLASALFGATTGLLFRRLVADSRGGE
jgi:hypothetical protein